MNTRNHGGARPGSGPKPTPIHESRVHALIAQGISQAEVARRMGVSPKVIRRVLRK